MAQLTRKMESSSTTTLTVGRGAGGGPETTAPFVELK
jgi:hypothetical protein